MPGESYCRQLRSLLLYLCDVFRALINSLVLVLHERSGPRSVSDFCSHLVKLQKRKPLIALGTYHINLRLAGFLAPFLLSCILMYIVVSIILFKSAACIALDLCLSFQLTILQVITLSCMSSLSRVYSLFFLFTIKEFYRS